MNRMVRWTVIVSALLGLAPPVQAIEKGVALHLWHDDTNLELIAQGLAETEATSWRDELTWAAVEKTKGVYALPANYQRVADAARADAKKGLRPMLILAYGNPLYEPGGLVTTPHARAGFAAYAHWVVTQMKGSVRYYEIWNEWNIGFGSTDKPPRTGSVADYVALLRAVVPVIRQADPDAIILAGGATNSDTAWFEAFIDADIIDDIDGISLHPYNYGHALGKHTPEAAILWVDDIQVRLRKKTGRTVPMHITEIGWPIHDNGYPALTVANFLDRFMQLSVERDYIHGVWWYDLVDDGNDSANREHRFGLYTYDGKARPAVERMRACCRARLTCARTQRPWFSPWL